MMPLSVPPMLPEDRKHLDVPAIPKPGMQFRKDGKVWQLASIDIQRGRFELPRLTLMFVAVDAVTFDCVDPKKASATSASPRLCVK